MTDQNPPTTDELLLKFATMLGDALFDFSIAIGRAVDVIRPDLSGAIVSRDLSPHEQVMPCTPEAAATVEHLRLIGSPPVFRFGQTDPLTERGAVARCRPEGCEVCR